MNICIFGFDENSCSLSLLQQLCGWSSKCTSSSQTCMCGSLFAYTLPCVLCLLTGPSSSLNTTLPSNSAWTSIRASNHSSSLSSTAQSTSGTSNMSSFRIPTALCCLIPPGTVLKVMGISLSVQPHLVAELICRGGGNNTTFSACHMMRFWCLIFGLNCFKEENK